MEVKPECPSELIQTNRKDRKQCTHHLWLMASPICKHSLYHIIIHLTVTLIRRADFAISRIESICHAGPERYVAIANSCSPLPPGVRRAVIFTAQVKTVITENISISLKSSFFKKYIPILNVLSWC